MISWKSKGHPSQSEDVFYPLGLLPVVPSILFSLQARTPSLFAKASMLTELKSVSLEKADLSLNHITSPRHSYRVLHSVFKLILTMNGLTSSYPKTTFPPEIKLCKSFSRQLRQNLPLASPSFSARLPQVRSQQGARRLPVCTHCHWGRRLATTRVGTLPMSQQSWTPDLTVRLLF